MSDIFTTVFIAVKFQCLNLEINFRYQRSKVRFVCVNVFVVIDFIASFFMQILEQFFCSPLSVVYNSSCTFNSKLKYFYVASFAWYLSYLAFQWLFHIPLFPQLQIKNSLQLSLCH